MSVANIRKTTEEKMVKSIESLKTDLQKVRTGRAHTGILDHVQVDYYGSMVPISQVANMSLADARTIVVQPWEKNMANAVEKAIRESDLGLNPASMGETIRVPMPALAALRSPPSGLRSSLRSPSAYSSNRSLRRQRVVRLYSPRPPYSGDAGLSGSGRFEGQISSPPIEIGNRHDQQMSVIGLTNLPVQRPGPAAAARAPARRTLPARAAPPPGAAGLSGPAPLAALTGARQPPRAGTGRCVLA